MRLVLKARFEVMRLFKTHAIGEPPSPPSPKTHDTRTPGDLEQRKLEATEDYMRSLTADAVKHIPTVSTFS
jgi:hypothetical protein